MEKLSNYFRRKVRGHEAIVVRTEFERDLQPEQLTKTSRPSRPFLAQIDSESPSGPSRREEATNALKSSLEVFSDISMQTLRMAATLLLESVEHVQDIFQDEDDLLTFAERMTTLSSMVAKIDHQKRLSDYQPILDRFPNELYGLLASMQSSFNKFSNNESHPNVTRKCMDELNSIIEELSLALQRNGNQTGYSNQTVFLEKAFTLQSTSQAIRQRFDRAIIDTSLPGGGALGGAIGANNSTKVLDQSFERARIVTGGGAVGSGNTIVPTMSTYAFPTAPDAWPPHPHPPRQRPSAQFSSYHDRFRVDPDYSRHPEAHHGFRQHDPSHVSPLRDIPSPLNGGEDLEWSRHSEYANSSASTASKLGGEHSVPQHQEMLGTDISSVQEEKSQIQQTH